MKVTILLPVYINDNPIFLQKALMSLWTNRPNCWELLILCDGPIDNKCEEIIQDYCRHGLIETKIIRHAENIGLGPILNLGIKFSESSWLLRMDADDICNEDRLDLMYDTIEREGMKYDVIGAQIKEAIDLNLMNEIGTRTVPLKHNEICKCIVRRNPMNHVTVVLKRDALIEVGGYHDFQSFEDYDLWCRLIHRGFKFMNLSQTTVRVRVGDDMIGRRIGWRYAKQELKMQRHIYRLGLSSLRTFLFYSFVRATPRLFPKPILKKIYSLMRS